MKKNIKLYLGLIAFIIYILIDLFYFPNHPIFPDEHRFISEAMKFLKTGEFWTGTDRAWEMPLTAILYAPFFLLFKESKIIYAIRFFQALILIGEAIIISKIVYILYKDKTYEFTAYLISLFYPFFVFFHGLLLSETFFTFLLTLSIYFLYQWYNFSFKNSKYFFLTNLFFVLSIYSRATLTILPPFLIGIFFYLNKKDRKRSFKILLYALILYIAFMSPWWIRNYTIFHSFVPFTTSSSANLYLGNNDYNLHGGIRWEKDVNPKVVAHIKSIKNELERQKAFTKEAIKFIKKNPEKALKLMWFKFMRFWSIIPNAKEYRKSIYLYISIFSYGIILILSIWNFIYNIRDFGKFSAIYILVAYFAVIHSLVIASIRYRLPIEPFLIVLATGIIWKFVYLIKNKSNLFLYH